MMRLPILLLASRICAASLASLHLAPAAPAQTALVDAKTDPGTGQILVTDAGRPVLRYNYRAVEPGEILGKVHPDNLKYARARSDYIHPLYGLDGEELTLDWPVDHPHHRGIYWAWPEVDYRGERGDLHALQRVFARPVDQCRLESGTNYAQIDAVNLWLWEDRQAIVREQVLIRAFHATATGRYIELELRFAALEDDVAIARRGTDQYGGLNIRLAAVKNQEITFHTDPPGSVPRAAWATLSGVFAGRTQPAALTVVQSAANPGFPGDWVKFPELNWFQPTFPAAQNRYVLRGDQPLTLRYRLWIHRGNSAGDQSGRAD